MSTAKLMGGTMGRLARGATVLFLAFTLSGCSRTLSEGQLFQPRPGPALTAELTAATVPAYRFEPLQIQASDGTTLRGGLLRREGASATIIYFGGNIATAARTGLRMARAFEPLGVNLVLVDTRGNGGSEAGPPSPEALKDDGLRVFDHVRALPGVDPARLVVHGHSMGSLIAGWVAAERDAAAVVLESSATTTRDFVATQTPWFARPFVRVRLSPELERQGNLAVMPRIAEPLLLLVGSEDRDTPPAFTRALYEASPLAAPRKQMRVVDGAGHSDVMEQDEARAAYRELLGRL